MIFNIDKVRRVLTMAASVLAVLAAPLEARANPRPLPFTYPYETLPQGSSEIELYTDTTPLRVEADATDPTRGRLWEPFYRLQMEYEYGITDRTELGIYQVFQGEPQTGGGNVFSFDGMKARIRTRLAEAGEWPVDVAFYFEVSALHDELELEEKILLQRRFGALRVMGNLWVEQELERPFDDSPHRGQVELFINPTLGATYELAPKLQVGAEYWVRGRIGGEDAKPTADATSAEAQRVDRRNDEMHHFLGPTFHYNMGRAWLTLGMYAHLNDMSRPTPGEIYGPFWFRSVLGIDL